MTNQEDTPTQVYVPALRRELVPCALPETVLFCDPGLPQTAAVHGFFHPRTFPFSREQAARVLGELLAVGEALDVASVSGKLAARASMQHGQALSVQEKTDIARFAAPASHNAAPENDPRIAAQKVLLLAWDLETRLLEIASLRREVAEAVGPLAENLRGSRNGDSLDDAALRDFARALPGVMPESFADLPETLEPDWRLSLAAIAAFIPENAVLFTCHAGMLLALREGGMLGPLPAAMASATACWPEKTRPLLLWAKTPLWKILGYTRAPENAPWLAAAPDIIVCPA